MVNGYTVTSRDIENLEDEKIVELSFVVADILGYGTSDFGKTLEFNKKLERKIVEVYCKEDCKFDIAGNAYKFENDKLRCRCHDCRDTACGGLGKIFYVPTKELKILVKRLKG